MYWYDPTSHASERVAAPSNDDEAVRMHARTPTLLLRWPAVRRTDTPLSAPMGFLSGLEAQSEISELLDELYGDGLA